MGLDQNELVELEITNVAHGGVTVARLDGRVVFVADGIPGERVLARVADDAKSSFWRADTVEVLDASPDRVDHVWSAASIDRAPEQRAGGAEFGHIALARQRALKAEVLIDSLRRMGGIEHDTVTVQPIHEADATGDGTRWRTRLRLHVGSDGRLGPYAARSHTVVDVDDLPLATAAIEAAAAADRGSSAAAVEFVETSDGDVRVRAVAEERSKTGGRGARGDRARGSARGEGGRDGARDGSARGDSGRDSTRGGSARVDDRTRRDAGGAARSTGRRGTPSSPRGSAAPLAAHDLDPRGAHTRDAAVRPGTIVERVGDREFRLAENGFWQVHHAAARTLTDAVADLTRADLFDPRAANHDLYGGVGLLAAALGDRFGPTTRITSVESDPTATDHAAGNLSEWVGAQAVTARVDRYLADLERAAGPDERRRLAAATMVIDPPRTGAGKPVVEPLTRLGVAQVVYVACDPVAFARDAGYFREGGYRLDVLRAYDLFPHTHHFETVGVFVKEG